jgi:hypothetical protein
MVGYAAQVRGRYWPDFVAEVRCEQGSTQLRLFCAQAKPVRAARYIESGSANALTLRR